MIPNLEKIVEGSVLVFNKPYGWTSFDLVKKVRNTIRKASGLKKIKVGHAGTLDPLATGVLVICTGKKTKIIEEIQNREKEYTGSFFLGATTPSFDLETEIDNRFPTDHLTEEIIKQATQKFIGVIDQTPPIFSAVKIQGKRAYEYAREGKEVKIESKKVEIKKFVIEKINLPEVDFRVICSKGTYIRSLARDFGNEINSGAHLVSLCRTRVGEYKIEESIDINKFFLMSNRITHKQ
ncbi:MAG: tRNA pseudouridine(55) synthase TruB [Bacteroidales bacterium]